MKPTTDVVHPLDADIEDSQWTESSDSSGSYRQLMKWSVIVGGVAFFVALIGSVIGNNATGDRQLESIAIAMNRYGMLVLLLSAFCILIAVRGPKVASVLSTWSAGKLHWPDWVVLLVINLVGFGILSLLFIGLGLITGPYFGLIAACLFPTASALMLTIAIWHQGIVRAYAIGFLSTLLMLLILLIGSGALFWALGALGGPYGSYNPVFSSGYYNGPGLFVPVIWFLSSVALSAFSGLVCAAYVAVLERVRHRIRTAPSPTEPNTPRELRG